MAKTIDNIRARIANIIQPNATNSMGQDLARSFFKYGNRKPLTPDWSQVIMSDEDLYTGYGYGAIKRIANGTAQLAVSNLNTNAATTIQDRAKAARTEVIHPYLELINSSKSFSNYWFWFVNSIFLDLEGVSYILVIRNVEGGRVGKVQEFKLLNPYNVVRVRSQSDPNTIGGYVETVDGFTREIPKEMIIDIRELNPFNWNEPFAMTDAAKDSSFTLKQASDYTRHSLKNNMSAPGIISTDVILGDDEFKDFRARIVGQEKGEPIFANGKGTVDWKDMQVDLTKSALDKITDVSRESFFAAAGVSKTMMGIEQSGVTRDSSKAQKDLFTEITVIPRLQLIIDALNQDYKNYYDNTTDQYNIYVDNPLGIDKDGEIKDVDIRTSSYELFNSLVNKGYSADVAAKYAEGAITLEELGEPTNAPVMPLSGILGGSGDNEEDNNEAEPTEDTPTSESHNIEHDHQLEAIHNQFDEESQGIINQQQAVLQNAVVNIEEQLTLAVLNKVTKNNYKTESDIIDPQAKKEALNDLELVIAAFYGIIIPLYASTVLSRRTKEFGMTASFKLDPATKRYIKTTANKASQSHVKTVLDDLLQSVQQASLEGATQQEMIAAIRQEYNTISANRAKTIARTETNRAFTRSQFEADSQFIKANDLEGRAYKKWITRSDNPCPLCQAKAAEPPIPFKTAFAELGDELTAVYEQDGKTKVLKQTVGFEDVEAGNLHPNCSCAYQLIIE